MTDRLGATVTKRGVDFAVRSSTATSIQVCLFDASGERETGRVDLVRDGIVWSATGLGVKRGARYGLRADGPYAPDQGLWFDPAKLLVDPYAVELDRPFAYHPMLAARRGEGPDTAPLMPKAIVASDAGVPVLPPVFTAGGLVYEVQVRALTMLHPEIPEPLRGTVAALAQPVMLDHFRKIGVSAVELMPVTAWIDERHLPPLGLSNGWGYNPVALMALDPRLVPGGVRELRDTVTALRQAGIGVILDLVFNHTGESDQYGPTLSLRGLDAPEYFAHADGQPGTLLNDTGTGNTLACDRPGTRALVLDALRHFVRSTGVDGFRFDLAPIMGRVGGQFRPDAPLLEEMRADPLLADRVMIAEPWDIGYGGYQLGNFRPPFLEWSDRYRDDIRRFWRGDGAIGDLATRLAGSSDIFSRDGATETRSVNFIAAHDGMTLADLVSFEHKHNEANGENNRDGHGENFSWNGGVEGASDDPAIVAQRRRDIRALLATLFVSRGTIMLTAGDEFGRTQRGNNNAYAQDNDLTWLDWAGRDVELEDYVATLAAMRGSMPVVGDTTFLTGAGEPADVEWLTEQGASLTSAEWERPERRRLAMLLADASGERCAILINGDRRATPFVLPQREGFAWVEMPMQQAKATSNVVMVDGRSVGIVRQRPV